MFAVNEYGDGIAAVFDRICPPTPDADARALFVHDEAPDGRVPELGTGNGRLELPLAGPGLRVRGYEVSDANG